MNSKSILSVSVAAILLLNHDLQAQQFRNARVQRGGSQFVPGYRVAGINQSPERPPFGGQPVYLQPHASQKYYPAPSITPDQAVSSQSRGFGSGEDRRSPERAVDRRGSQASGAGENGASEFGRAGRRRGAQAEEGQTADSEPHPVSASHSQKNGSSEQSTGRYAGSEESPTANGKFRQTGASATRPASNHTSARTNAAPETASGASATSSAPLAQTAAPTAASAKSPAAAAPASGISLPAVEQAGANALATSVATETAKSVTSALGLSTPAAAPAPASNPAPSSGSDSLVSDIISGAGDLLGFFGL